MTKSTDSKNIKIIVQGILTKYKIDNLQLEVDLCSAWQRYLNERKEGLTPAEVRQNITDEFAVFGVTVDSTIRSKLKERMETALGLNIDEGKPSWETIVTFCKTQEHYKGETIEKFVEWCKSDPYNSPKKHQIAQNPMLIKVMWRSAFEEKQAVSLEDMGWN